MKRLIPALLIFIASAVSAQEETRELTLPAAGIETLTMDCGAGFLVVRGEGSAISLSAKIRTGLNRSESQRFIERYVRLTLEKRGDQAILEGRIDYDGDWDDRDMGIDLTVTLPKNINLDINDGSGSLAVSNMGGQVRIVDGSGSIEIRDLSGDLKISDGSGGIDVERVKGDIRIDDGSGSMTLTDIGGNVDVTDGSGSIDIDGVEHDVRIRSAGRGGVHIAHVKGKVRRDDE